MVTGGNGEGPALWDRPNPEILDEFGRRIRAAERTATTYRQRISAQLGRFAAERGWLPSLKAAVTSPELLAQILSVDGPLVGSQSKVDRRYLTGVRSAFRRLITVLPPPDGWTRDGLRGVLTEARRLSSTQRGLRYRTDSGRRSPRRDAKPVPTAGEIERVIEALGTGEHSLDLVSAQVVAFAYATGCRIAAILELKREHLLQTPDQRVWVAVAEKARPERTQVLVRGLPRTLVESWLELAPGEPLWTGPGRQALTYTQFLGRLRTGCMNAGVTPFTPHRLRHAFATDASVRGGSRRVQEAGGWRGARVVNSYIHPLQGRLEDVNAELPPKR